MKRTILAATLAITALLISDVSAAQTPEPPPPAAAAIQPGAQAEPIVVLIEYDPWKMVLGSDTPRLALYDDGVVIYAKDRTYLAARLTREETQAFTASLDPEALARVSGSYRASTVTDQPTTVLMVRSGSSAGLSSVYGSPRSATVPAEIRAAYERLVAFAPADAAPWRPEAVEVTIWPYDYAPEESIIWPEDLPGLDHPDTRHYGDNYSLFVPIEDFPRLVEFLRTRRQKGAVLIGGQKWMADIRWPFPKEERWMGVE